jgi:uncharacterized protein (DUF1697 family)
MMTWIALLRGINVGGHRRVPMAELRALLTERGLKDVRTVIQSGNVVFESSHRSAERAAEPVKEAIHSGFGHDVDVVMRTKHEFDDVVLNDPFAGDTPADMRVNVAFMEDAPPAAVARALESLDGGPERVRVIGRELYWLRLPNYNETVYTQAVFDRHLGKAVTVRNLDVVKRIAALAARLS